MVLDTHVFVWLITDNSLLGPRSRTMCRKAMVETQLGVSAFTFWELEMLAQRGRLELDRPIEIVRSESLATGLIEFPVDGETAIRSCRLNWNHKDPADRIIVASALVREATLVTADRAILDWKFSVGKFARQDARK